MAKKKPDEPALAPGGKKKQVDQHVSARMVRLSEADHDTLKDLAQEHGRPVTWELRQALDMYFQACGKRPRKARPEEGGKA